MIGGVGFESVGGTKFSRKYCGRASLASLGPCGEFGCEFWLFYVICFYGATLKERREDFCDSQFWGHLRNVGRTTFSNKFGGRASLASLGPYGDICANF